MQKSILNIKLVNRPVMRESHIERGANSSRLHTGLKFSEKSMPGRWVKPQRIQRALYRSRDPSAWYLCLKIHFSVTILAPAGWAQDRRCDFAADIMLFYRSCSPVGVRAFRITQIISILLFLNLADQCVSLLTKNALTWLYVGVASVINEANRSNDVIPQLTSELNERTTDKWLV